MEIPTLGTLLRDGSVLEAVYPHAGAGLRLAVHRGQSCSLPDKVEFEGLTYVPPEIDSDWFTACRFAPGVGRAEHAADLFTDLIRLFTRTLGQTAETAAILGFFVLSTWFADVLPLAPVLLLIDNGDYTVGVVRRCLQVLCRRSVALAEFNRAALLQLPAGLNATLFLEQSGISPQGQRLLLMTARPGAHLIRRGRPQQSAAAKVIRCPDPGELSEVAECAVAVLPCTPVRAPAVNLDVEPIAAEFQPRLLAYRLANLIRVRDSGFAASKWIGRYGSWDAPWGCV